MALSVTNADDPIATVTTLASIPNNYYVLVFAVNGRQKYIYHYRSNGELVFEDVHTMGTPIPQKSARQELG